MKKISLFLLGVLSTIIIGVIISNSAEFSLITKIKYDRLILIEEKYEKAEKIKNDLLTKYYQDITEEAIETGMYRGMFEATNDKYSVYMTKEELEKYNESTRGEYVGIGILSDVSDGNIKITRIFPNSPAEKVGLKLNDFIIQVDDLVIEEEGYSKLIDTMLGEVNTDVVIKILRENKELIFNIKRGDIEIPFVTSKKINDIGYIYIYKFGTDTAKEFNNHLKILENQNIKGLIIDLRNNPGGLVSESTKIADKLMDKRLIIYTMDKEGRRVEYKSDSNKIDIPFVMLGNENSASASEILLAAIKDSESAKIVGTKTFGKGIVQGITNLRDGSGYKITFSEYFTENNNKIHGIGVTPDYIVDYNGIIIGENPNFEEDLQLIKSYEIISEIVISN